MVVVVPDQADQTVLSGQHAQFQVFFREIDPLQAAWVRYFSTVAVQELNRRVLADLLGNRRSRLAGGRGEWPGARAVRCPDGRSAARRRGLGGSARGRDAAGAAGGADLAGLLDLAALGGEQADPLAPAEAELDGDRDRSGAGQVNTPDQIARAQRLQQTSRELEQQSQQVTKVPPDVLAAPFSVEATNTVPAEPTAIGFFRRRWWCCCSSTSPSAWLRSRWCAIGCSARWRCTGWPRSGRWRSSWASRSATACCWGWWRGAGLLVNQLLGVPILGAPLWAVVTLALLLFSSFGLGFFVAGLAQTETQAVQLAMLVLLASIFFGGFFLALDTLWTPIRTISYFLPVTFGSHGLARGDAAKAVPEPMMLAALALIGVLCYAIGAWQFSRRMSIQ